MASTSSIPLSERAAKHVGGVRRRDETPQQFRDRMDTAAIQTGQMPRGVTMPMAQPPGGQTRQDRIIAARMQINPDGTSDFDTKRNAFNAANAAKGLTMDEAGNIVPLAQNPGTQAAPPSQSPSLPVSQSPTPATATQTATTAAAGAVGGPAAVVGRALAMPQRKPATFEGMSMEQFKTSRTIEQPTLSANPTAVRHPGGGFVMPRGTPPVTPPSVTPPVTRNVTASRPVTPAPTPTASTAIVPRTSPTAVKQKYGDNWKVNPAVEKRAKDEADNYEYDTKIAPAIQQYRNEQKRKIQDKARAVRSVLDDVNRDLTLEGLGGIQDPDLPRPSAIPPFTPAAPTAPAAAPVKPPAATRPSDSYASRGKSVIDMPAGLPRGATPAGLRVPQIALGR